MARVGDCLVDTDGIVDFLELVNIFYSFDILKIVDIVDIVLTLQAISLEE